VLEVRVVVEAARQPVELGADAVQVVLDPAPPFDELLQVRSLPDPLHRGHRPLAVCADAIDLPAERRHAARRVAQRVDVGTFREH
jgi:hypothetical protein